MQLKDSPYQIVTIVTVFPDGIRTEQDKIVEKKTKKIIGVIGSPKTIKDNKEYFVRLRKWTLLCIHLGHLTKEKIVRPTYIFRKSGFPDFTIKP